MQETLTSISAPPSYEGPDEVQIPRGALLKREWGYRSGLTDPSNGRINTMIV